MNDPVAALDYHTLTAHAPNRRRPDDVRLLRGYRAMDASLRPPPFKEYDVEATALPDLAPLDVDAGAALSGAAVEVRPLDAALLSTLLFRSAGVVRTRAAPFGELSFRAAGSAGNLHPLEVYVVAAAIDGLDDGVYHYDPQTHGLKLLAPGPGAGPAAIVVTGVPWRTAWKYTERGFRHLYWDCGTMLAHVLAIAEVVGLDARVLLGFVDRDVTALVGADGDDEFPLAVVALGPGEPVLEPRAPARAGRLAPDAVRFPLITATQRAGDLTDAAAVEAWRMEGEPRQGRAVPLPGGAALTLDDTFDRRGSTRRFGPDAAAAPRPVLDWALAAAARPVPADFLEPGTTALSHRVAVHAVDGYDPGAYVWLGDGFEQVRAGPVRDDARGLCLGQDLGGGGAYTVFHCADLDLLYFLGSRGYRAVQLEAGVVEGRVHLAAFALGFGATGLTFFDDEVRRYFATRSSPMLVTAVGAPAYRARRGGRPRHPTNMA